MLKVCRLLTKIAETDAKYLKGDCAGSLRRKACAPGDQSFRHRCPPEIPHTAAEVQNKYHTHRTDRRANMRRTVGCSLQCLHFLSRLLRRRCLFAFAAATAAELPAHHLACACESSLAFNRQAQIGGPGPAVVKGAVLPIRHLPDDLGQALGPCRRDGLASWLASALHGRFRRCSHSRQIRAVTRLRS